MNTQDFPILANGDIVYLDNAATTQKPHMVIRAITTYYETSNANVHRGIHTLSEKATIQYEDAREKVAQFIGAKSNEIVFTKGTTSGLNMLAWGLGDKINEGDEIVISCMEHHANLIPWQRVARAKKAVLKIIPLGENYELDLSEAKKLITPKTKIVAITHVSNTLGTINPVKEIIDIAHEHQAFVVIDAAQSVPHIKIDVKDLGCDFLVFSAHKMCGPTGVGVLYGIEELLETMEPYQVGGGMIKEVTFENATWQDTPERFEAGTPNIAGVIGFASAIEYLEHIGLDIIYQHGMKLCEYALLELGKIEGLTIIGPQGIENRLPVISFTLKGIHPHDVAQIVNRDGVAIRAGHHCTMPLMKVLGIEGTSRISLYLYNEKKDIDTLILGIKKVIEVFK
jgi:cysteine desulfurase / selenocysteine lyase